MKLDSQNVGLLVQRALCLGALSDKEGCTTRYVDLPGRPLEDFIIAGVNVGPVFQSFASDRIEQGEKRIFHRFVDALKVSNQHKSDKFVNFGLLEILFPTVAARLVCSDPSKVAGKIVELMREAPASDVAEMIKARQLAWSTSTKRGQKLADITDKAFIAPNPYDFYEAVFASAPTDSASSQWVSNYYCGVIPSGRL